MQGKKLLRSADSGDPDTKALAWAMFAKGLRRLRDLEKRMRGPYVGEINALSVKHACESVAWTVPWVVNVDGFGRAIGV